MFTCIQSLVRTQDGNPIVKYVFAGPVSVLPPGAFRRGSDILQHEVRSKISLMPEDALGGNTDTGPDI